LTRHRRVDYVPRVRSTLQVSLRGLRFHALVGVLPHEREVPQPLEIDVSVWLRAGLPASPPPLDYRELYADAAGEVARGPVAYLEELADSIGRAALRREGAERVRVVARKPHVALPGPLAAAEVVVELWEER
jgi:FolB domain-containing protein